MCVCACVCGLWGNCCYFTWHGQQKPCRLSGIWAKAWRNEGVSHACIWSWTVKAEGTSHAEALREEKTCCEGQQDSHCSWNWVNTSQIFCIMRTFSLFFTSAFYSIVCVYHSLIKQSPIMQISETFGLLWLQWITLSGGPLHMFKLSAGLFPRSGTTRRSRRCVFVFFIDFAKL